MLSSRLGSGAGAEGVEDLSDRAYCVGGSTVHSVITCSGFDALLD
jgi:hypothetical protein